MTGLIDAVCILIVFFSLFILATPRIMGMIRLFAAQSFVLSLMPIIFHLHAISGYDIVICLGAMILKALLVPYVLLWTIRHVSMRSEVKPLIGFGASVVAAAGLVAVAFWVASSLKFPDKVASDMVLPCSLATVLLGFMMMVTRTRAVTQVIGYLVMENGLFLFALSLFDAMPLFVEMGILLDIFVAVFIMAIVANHINEEFEKSGTSMSRSKMGETF